MVVWRDDVRPMLESQVKSAGGVVRLAKLNVEEQEKLAGILKVRSLPTVFLIQSGRVVSSFSGSWDMRFALFQVSCWLT